MNLIPIIYRFEYLWEKSKMQKHINLCIIHLPSLLAYLSYRTDSWKGPRGPNQLNCNFLVIQGSSTNGWLKTSQFVMLDCLSHSRRFCGLPHLRPSYCIWLDTRQTLVHWGCELISLTTSLVISSKLLTNTDITSRNKKNKNKSKILASMTNHFVDYSTLFGS